MDQKNMLPLLTSNMNLEPVEGSKFPIIGQKQQDSVTVSHAQLPNGSKITLLKTLLTSACERNCYYCPFQSHRNYRRATLSPEEMAEVFMAMYRAGIVQGLFLSSGIAGGGIKSQDNLIDCAEILRHKYKFTGYFHLKIMPGAEYSQIERSLQLADRVSINLEAPNPKRLQLLAPKKEFYEELINPMRWINEIKTTKSQQEGWNGKWPSLVTQFVVGAVEDTDIEILETTLKLRASFNISRAYYSTFQPIRDTPLENNPPVAKQRQHRLYQASFLLRDYGYGLEDMTFDNSGNLLLSEDPKLIWAKSNLLHNPVEINNASKQALLRVPGLGPKSVQIILNSRSRGTLSTPEGLKGLGIYPDRALPYILLNGKRPNHQLSLF